ncbi:60S acidic ribosomal protein P0 [Histoplasma capsulatum G186AR]|uniref:60S acidic ribosomal protein P0 n=1 Tax=Ajellomyces capsulatus TaxID=5037 RepID=A0A8H7Z817_AJECA|nr:60S acidic ribosomal protein P0 [Histoplasma capsulatum]QSS71722.1 60S acidic ribosomal protein P0 [Histoplasma capsulatum G186AR]
MSDRRCFQTGLLPLLVPVPSLLWMSMSPLGTPAWNPEKPLSSRLSVSLPRLLVVPLKLPLI